MSELMLLPGPRLERREWDYNSETGVGATVAREVTEHAAEYLFHDIELHPDVVFSDILGLLKADPVLQVVFQSDFAPELLAEASQGPLPQNGGPQNLVESIELVQAWGLNSSTHEYSEVGSLSVRAKSPALTEDVYDGEELLYSKGESIVWALSFKCIRELLTVPFKLSDTLMVSELDVDSMEFGSVLLRATNKEIKLGELIQQVLKFVTPQNYFNLLTRQDARLDELSPATTIVVRFERNPAEDASLGLIAAFSFYLEGLKDENIEDVQAEVRKFSDDALISVCLATSKCPEVTVKKDFSQLTCKTLRKLVRESQALLPLFLAPQLS